MIRAILIIFDTYSVIPMRNIALSDSPASEHKRMKEFADTHGFKFLNPDVNVGTRVKKLLDMLSARLMAV